MLVSSLSFFWGGVDLDFSFTVSLYRSFFCSIMGVVGGRGVLVGIISFRVSPSSSRFLFLLVDGDRRLNLSKNEE